MIPIYQLPTPVERRDGFNTPEPVYVRPVPPQLVPAPAVPDRRARIRAAAYRATLVYPGPAGQLIKRELEAADEFGQAIDHRGLTMQVVDQVLQQPLPATEAQP